MSTVIISALSAPLQLDTWHLCLLQKQSRHAGFSWLKHWLSWPGVGHRPVPHGHQEHYFGHEGELFSLNWNLFADSVCDVNEVDFVLCWPTPHLNLVYGMVYGLWELSKLVSFENNQGNWGVYWLESLKSNIEIFSFECIHTWLTDDGNHTGHHLLSYC